MFLRRKSWAQLTRGGIPPLFVIRPKPGFTTDFSDEVPIPDVADKVQVMRTRQLYEQKHIGVASELELTATKNWRQLVVQKG